MSERRKRTLAEPTSPPPPHSSPRTMASGVIGPSLTGVGRHWQTQLVLAVNFLKQLNRPIRLEDLALTSGIESLLHNYELVEALKAHDRVRYDPRTELVQYRPDFVLSSKSDLVALLRRYSPQGGLAVKPLRESWPAVTQAIEELEREGRVLVTRTDGKGDAQGKGQMKCVFLDDVGKDREPLDKEFRDLWHSLKTPLGDDLVSELQTGAPSLLLVLPRSSPATSDCFLSRSLQRD